MKTLKCILATAMIAAAVFANAADESIRLVFSKTKASTVIQSVALKSGHNVIFSGTSDPEISLNVKAANPEEALRFASAAAGLSIKLVDNTFIIAAPTEMRTALRPFAASHTIELKAADADTTAKSLEAAFPYVTASGSYGLLVMHALDEDRAGALEFVLRIDRKALSQTTRIYQARHVPAAGLGPALAAMYDALIVSVVDPAVGTITITGLDSDVAKAMEMASSLDIEIVKPPEEPVVMHLYTVRYSSAPALKGFLAEAEPDLQVMVGPESFAPSNPTFKPLSSASLGSSAGGGVASTDANTSQADVAGSLARHLVLRGKESAVERALVLLDELDIAPIQVSVKVEVVDYSPSEESDLGFSWNWTRFGMYEAAPGTGVETGGDPGGEFDSFETRPAGFGQFSRVPFSFQSVLKAMVERKEAQILATPYVQAIDNVDANIFIGETIRAKISQGGGIGGDTVEIVEFPVGIILLIRPRVNVDGDITMRVHPVVSTILGLNEDQLPQTSTREAETTIRVRDGETVVIGGLIREEMTKTLTAVPILSEIPLIGELFKSRSTSARKSEILVFITPTIIRDNEASEPATSDVSGDGS
jgi:type II secretory pathway component GspD/PulD (secretin)